MRITLLNKLVVGTTAMAVMVFPAQAQGWGDIVKGAVQDEADKQLCGFLGGSNCEREETSDDNQMSAGEVAIQLGLLQNQLSSNSVRTPTPSSAQSQLYDYSDNYAVQGGIIGGIALALAGCLLADYVLDASCSEGIIYGGLIGATVGAVAGSQVGQRQEIYRDNEISLNDKLTTARSDLEDARSARAAAEQVAASHRSRLTSLNTQYERGEVTREQLVREIGYATDDMESLTAASNGLGDQIALIEQSIANSQPDPAAQAEARQIIEDLREEQAGIDVALQALSGTVQQVRV